MKLRLFPLLLLCLNTQARSFTCADAQRLILNLPEEALNTLEIEDVAYDRLHSFILSKPALESTHITTGSFLSADGPYEQLWCKLKSQTAISAMLKAPAQGPVGSCASLNERLLQEALDQQFASQEDHPSLTDLGIRLLADQDFRTGSQWAPSQLGIKRTEDHLQIQARRLQTVTWVPVFGGMNYCKILSPKGAADVIIEALKLDKEGSHPGAGYQTQTLAWDVGGRLGKQSATLYFKGSVVETLQAAKGTYIISPGGNVAPEAMSGLAIAFAERGYASFVVRYPQNLAILDDMMRRGNTAIQLAERIKHDPSSLQGMDLTSLQGKSIGIFGHSLGGATLASEVYKDQNLSSVERIVLYGTAQFVKTAGSKIPASRPMALLFGEHDQLSQNTLPGFLKNFDLSFEADDLTVHNSPLEPKVVYQQLEGLNHFCIISDKSAGLALLRKLDGKGPEPTVCLGRLMDTLEQLGFL